MSKKTDPVSPADIFQLFNEVGIINQLSSTQFQKVLPHDLTQAQFGLLNHCVRLGDGWPPARLAAAFQVTKGTLTSTLKRLEIKGFIRIDPDPEDGRAKRVFLTDAGRQAREDAIKAAIPLLLQVQGALSPTEHGTLLALLTKLRIWLDEHRS